MKGSVTVAVLAGLLAVVLLQSGVADATCAGSKTTIDQEAGHVKTFIQQETQKITDSKSRNNGTLEPAVKSTLDQMYQDEVAKVAQHKQAVESAITDNTILNGSNTTENCQPEFEAAFGDPYNCNHPTHCNDPNSLVHARKTFHDLLVQEGLTTNIPNRPANGNPNLNQNPNLTGTQNPNLTGTQNNQNLLNGQNPNLTQQQMGLNNQLNNGQLGTTYNGTTQSPYGTYTGGGYGAPGYNSLPYAGLSGGALGGSLFGSTTNPTTQKNSTTANGTTTNKDGTTGPNTTTPGAPGTPGASTMPPTGPMDAMPGGHEGASASGKMGGGGKPRRSGKKSRRRVHRRRGARRRSGRRPSGGKGKGGRGGKGKH